LQQQQDLLHDGEEGFATSGAASEGGGMSLGLADGSSASWANSGNGWTSSSKNVETIVTENAYRGRIKCLFGK